MTIYGIVVERRVRVATGYTIAGMETLAAAKKEALELAEQALPGTGMGGLYVVSVEEFETADEAARWAEHWVSAGGRQGTDVTSEPAT